MQKRLLLVWRRREFLMGPVHRRRMSGDVTIQNE